MKKIVLMSMGLLCCLSLTACPAPNNTSEKADTTANEQENTETKEGSESSAKEDDSTMVSGNPFAGASCAKIIEISECARDKFAKEGEDRLANGLTNNFIPGLKTVPTTNPKADELCQGTYDGLKSSTEAFGGDMSVYDEKFLACK